MLMLKNFLKKSKLGNHGPENQTQVDGPGANLIYRSTPSIDPLLKPYFLYSGSQITQNVKSYLEAISKLKSPGKLIRSPDRSVVRTGPFGRSCSEFKQKSHLELLTQGE